MAASGDNECKQMSPEDTSFVNRTCEGLKLQPIFTRWCKACVGPNSFKDRIVVLTKLRVLTFRHKLTGRALSRNLPLLSLQKMSARPPQGSEKLATIMLVIAGMEGGMKIKCPQEDAKDLVQKIRYSATALLHNNPAVSRPNFEDVSGVYMVDYEEPYQGLPAAEKLKQSMILQYEAACDQLGFHYRPQVLLYLSEALDKKQTWLDVAECLDWKNSDSKSIRPQDVQSVAQAVRYNGAEENLL